MKKTVVGAVIALLAAGLFASLVVVKNLNGRIAELESARETAASAISDAPQAAKPAEGEGKAQEAKPVCVINYLTGRGISRSILDYCIDHKLLYESKDYHSAVFVG